MMGNSCDRDRPFRACMTWRVGSESEAAADEEHSEAVVVGVSESAGDAAGEFDQAVDGSDLSVR